MSDSHEFQMSKKISCVVRQEAKLIATYQEHLLVSQKDPDYILPGTDKTAGMRSHPSVGRPE